MKIYKTGNGNDMRSRSIEGKNPLYLPQANTFDGCAVHSRCIYVTDQPLLIDTMISIEIKRDNERAFEGSVGIAQMKRTVEELVSFVYRECNFSNGRLKMTGTGCTTQRFRITIGNEIIIEISHMVINKYSKIKWN